MARVYLHDNGSLTLLGIYHPEGNVLEMEVGLERAESAILKDDVALSVEKADIVQHADCHSEPDHSLWLFRAGRWDYYWLDKRRPCPGTVARCLETPKGAGTTETLYPTQKKRKIKTQLQRKKFVSRSDRIKGTEPRRGVSNSGGGKSDGNDDDRCQKPCPRSARCPDMPACNLAIAAVRLHAQMFALEACAVFHPRGCTASSDTSLPSAKDEMRDDVDEKCFPKAAGSPCGQRRARGHVQKVCTGSPCRRKCGSSAEGRGAERMRRWQETCDLATYDARLAAWLGQSVECSPRKPRWARPTRIQHVSQVVRRNLYMVAAATEIDARSTGVVAVRRTEASMRGGGGGGVVKNSS